MLEPLFDAELDYQPGMAPLTSAGDGALVGSGDGAVHGPKLNGKLEWTLFEQPGSTVCVMAPVARIITDDGAQIRFDGRGYGTRPSPSDPSWRVAATLYVTTDDAATPGSTARWPSGKASSTRPPTTPATPPSSSQPSPQPDQRHEPRTGPSLTRRRLCRSWCPTGPLDPAGVGHRGQRHAARP